MPYQLLQINRGRNFLPGVLKEATLNYFDREKERTQEGVSERIVVPDHNGDHDIGVEGRR